MSEYSRMLDTIKQAATEAVNAAKPFALTYGTVTKASPLSIRIDQKLELGPSHLLLTNAVRDYSVDMSMDHQTEDETRHTHVVTSGGEAQPVAHRHSYEGRKTFTIHAGLKAGEMVLLMRCQGGQQYIVLDRVEAPR